MYEVPVISHPVDRAVLAHRRHNNAIAERHAAECRWSEEIDLWHFAIVIGASRAAMDCRFIGRSSLQIAHDCSPRIALRIATVPTISLDPVAINRSFVDVSHAKVYTTAC
jgi:hypothetical protein